MICRCLHSCSPGCTIVVPIEHACNAGLNVAPVCAGSRRHCPHNNECLSCEGWRACIPHWYAPPHPLCTSALPEPCRTFHFCAQGVFVATIDIRCFLAGLNKSMRSMARNSHVINACFPLSIQPIEVPRYRAVNEEVALLPHSLISAALQDAPNIHLHFIASPPVPKIPDSSYSHGIYLICFSWHTSGSHKKQHAQQKASVCSSTFSVHTCSQHAPPACRW